jgi:hypothetical protein
MTGTENETTVDLWSWLLFEVPALQLETLILVFCSDLAAAGSSTKLG